MNHWTETDHKRVCILYMNCWKSTVTDMTTVQNFEVVSYRFNMYGISKW
jgi:hypothetical protein